VNNASSYTEFFDRFINTPNLIIIENISESTYELGAYIFATNYIIHKNLNFDYYICTQDTFVLVNEFNLNELKLNNTTACSISNFSFDRMFDLHKNVLMQLNMYEPNYTFLGCWCSSFCVTHEKLLQIYTILKDTHMKTKQDSIECERFMGYILNILNDRKSTSIEKGYEGYNYDVFSTEPSSDRLNYFIKCIQGKNNHTT
jgi:hypothetical protein